MMHYTIPDVLAWRPCEGYTPERLAELWAGRESLSARDMIDLPIRHEDRVWAWARAVPAPVARGLACDCAERALRRWEARHETDADPRCWNAVAVARRHAAGNATDEELDAAGAAAWAAGAAAWAAGDAAGDAAWAAARAAAWDAAWAAAGAAAWDAAWDAAERDWQLGRMRELCEVDP